MPHSSTLCAGVLFFVLVTCSWVSAQIDPVLANATDSSPAAAPDPKEVTSAITKAIKLIEISTNEYREQRQCFSCHHQAIATLALTEARQHGFQVDPSNLDEQLKLTRQHLESGKDRYLQGKGQGGRADTAGYALWTLETSSQDQRDDVTAAVAEFLLVWQKDQDYWSPTSRRPPSEASDFATTYLALRGLDEFGTDEQRERIDDRKAQVNQWLRERECEDTEDHVFRLRALGRVDADEATLRAAARELIDQQRADGGWAQRSEMQSDAYATGTVLAALYEYDLITVDRPAYQRALAFLIRTQRSDGSWLVETRSKPIQKYFESGFPYGEHQFISMMATSWATVALVHASPPGP